MGTFLDDQTKCMRCGDHHFTVVSLTDPHLMLACLECGYVWNVNQPVEDKSDEEDPPAVGGR